MIQIPVIVFILIIVFIAALIYAVITLLRKYERVASWLYEIQSDLSDGINEFIKIDNRGSFRNNDSVGAAWKNIMDVIGRLNYILERYSGKKEEG